MALQINGKVMSLEGLEPATSWLHAKRYNWTTEADRFETPKTEQLTRLTREHKSDDNKKYVTGTTLGAIFGRKFDHHFRF